MSVALTLTASTSVESASTTIGSCSSSAEGPAASSGASAFIDSGDPGAGRDATVTYFGRAMLTQCPIPIFREGDEITLSGGNFTVSDVQP